MGAGDMSPETWTQAELVRAVLDIKTALAEIKTELRAQRGEYVHADVWDEWKRQVAADIVDLEAEQARATKDRSDRERRIRQDLQGQMRWAIGTALTALAIALTAAGIWLV